MKREEGKKNRKSRNRKEQKKRGKSKEKQQKEKKRKKQITYLRFCILLSVQYVSSSSAGNPNIPTSGGA